MKTCMVALPLALLAALCWAGSAAVPMATATPRKSCLECPNEQSLWPICCIEVRTGSITVKNFQTRCQMDKYNCEHNRNFFEFFAGACEGPNINTRKFISDN